MTHNRGTMVSPLVIKQVLEKFIITDEEFLDALENRESRRPSASPPPPPIQ
jgi:hypothetical protein